MTDAWQHDTRLRAALGLGERYRVLVLTDDQFEIIGHLTTQARDAADALHAAYYAGIAKAAAPA